MDPLEDVLSVIGTTSYLSTRMVADGGGWRLGPEPDRDRGVDEGPGLRVDQVHVPRTLGRFMRPSSEPY
ncbi:hypothetical protein [Kineosporia sp. NBRC 101731]|uniref:hypothetical protein n=1 Tax=Kineosporia sp. NBRC 101731 TaxID=3032199 RepID=UPI002553F54F|nr:hypothetical protein [Kineosporia sp. NBRC 101731]